MHISDGILSPQVCAGGFATAAALAGFALRKTAVDDVPKVSVMSAVFFVSSLIHFRVGVSSVHLLMVGLVGIVLGPMAPTAILTGLLFQMLMFGHGGITTLGVNTSIMSSCALLAYGGYRLASRFSSNMTFRAVAAGVVSVIAVFAGAAMVLAVLILTSRELAGIAALFSASHAVVALLEGVVSAVVVLRLQHLKPEALPG